MEKIKLYLDQLDNGWVLQDETEAQSCYAEIARDKDIRYQLGLAIFDYVRNAMDEDAGIGGDRHWKATISIGDDYYETDPYADKQDAIDEQRGCLLAIKEQIEKYLDSLS